jgi:hypothetical protein
MCFSLHHDLLPPTPHTAAYSFYPLLVITAITSVDILSTSDNTKESTFSTATADAPQSEIQKARA